MIAATLNNEEKAIAFLEGLSHQEKTKSQPGRSLRLMKNGQTGELRAAYDSAQTTDANQHYWKNADLLSADSANSPEIRKTLRSRSRYECLEANSFAKGIVNTLANDTVGRGPKLQLQLQSEELNTQIETSFQTWAKRIKLAKKLRTARKSKFIDGEVFIRLVTNRKLPGPIQLDIEVIEADRVCNPMGIVNEEIEVDGILFDADGNPSAYRVLKSHPGGNSFSMLETELVPANQMIHLFREDRPGQHRGIPECTTALPLFILFRDYTLAVVQNARTVARHTMMLKTTSGAVFDEGETFDSTVDPFDTVDIDYDMMTSLPHGWEPFQLRADQPTTTYEMFRRAIWGEIARTANMPYNIAAGDSSKHNYASGRLDIQPYDYAIDVERSDWEIDCIDRLLEAWFDEASLVGILPNGIGSHEELPHEWFWPSRGHADPSKEANGQATRLRSGTTNRRRELKKEGIDIDSHDRESAESYGVTVPEYRRMIAASTFNAQSMFEPISDEEEEDEIEDKAAEKTTA